MDDCFLTDRYVTPAGQEPFFNEKLVYFPDAYLPTNRDQPISEHSPSREECGLPDTGFVYCSFNAADKIEPEIFDVWMRILSRVPESVLWQRCDESIVQKRLRQEAKSRDIDPERLVFAGQLTNLVPDHGKTVVREPCSTDGWTGKRSKRFFHVHSTKNTRFPRLSGSPALPSVRGRASPFSASLVP